MLAAGPVRQARCLKFMSMQQVPFAKRAEGMVPRIVSDRRRYRRVAITLLGRFMRDNRQEHACKLHDISVGGAALMAPVSIAMGEHIVAYFDHLGGLEGHVCRVYDGGFALNFVATQHKREKIAAQLTWLVNQHEFKDLEARRHDRVATGNNTHALTLSEGLTITCQMLDFSISGASIATPARPTLGTEVKLGNLRARVVRHHDQGIGVQFIDVQSPNALRRYFG